VSLRGKRTPRERARRLLAPLLDQGLPPDLLLAARRERFASSSARRKEVRGMFSKLSDTTKGAIFSVLVLVMAVGVALLIRMLELTPSPGMWVFWSCTPTVAALIMLLIVTREGYSREGWKSLGLHRLGLSVWWIAFGLTLLITVAASAIVWATLLASFVVPEDGIIDPLIGFLIQISLFTLTFALWEEIGMRGYLLPKLLSLGRNRALAWSGLVWAAWHMPLILLTPVFPVGNKLISLPLFVATVVTASFVYGYLRIYTGSVWPASIAHSVHNAAWGTLGAFTATSYPVIVNKYLVGDYGILILVGAVLGVIWINRRLMRSSPDEPLPSGASGEASAI
jgi:membrane protease YdiL (CAAX protease family)